MLPYLAFVAAMALSIAGTLAGLWAGRRFGIMQVPGGRRKHVRPVSRLGGLALLTGFCGTGLGLYLFAPLPKDVNLHLPLVGALAGTAFAVIWGLADDWLELSPGPQFVLQAITAVIAIAADLVIGEVTLPAAFGFGLEPTRFLWYLSLPLTVFWVMGMMNTVNWLDGLDGLAVGVAAIAAACFAAHSYKLGQDEVALYSLALCGACLGLLLFNFHPARIFLGSAGAMGLGFALSSMSIIAPARVMTALLILAIPIADVAFQIVDRWRRRQSPLRGDRGHIHFRLSDLGLPQRPIVLGYYLVCIIYGLAALWIDSRWVKVGIFAGLVLAVFLLLTWLRGRQPGMHT
jgi:UDP-GlcNAc:undecaprenyl-phosphate GlcNAc-1-phosphate transferase